MIFTLNFILQRALVLWMIIKVVEGRAPPGYVKPPEEPDKNPPKYEYGYNIADQEKGTGHGKLETREGIYALGRYYVQADDSSQNVQYFADDWGFHPVVQYNNAGPHSQASAQFALGSEAVNALRNLNKTSSANQEITQIINTKLQEQKGQLSVAGANLQSPQLILQPIQTSQLNYVNQENANLNRENSFQVHFINAESGEGNLEGQNNYDRKFVSNNQQQSAEDSNNFQSQLTNSDSGERYYAEQLIQNQENSREENIALNKATNNQQQINFAASKPDDSNNYQSVFTNFEQNIAAQNEENSREQNVLSNKGANNQQQLLNFISSLNSDDETQNTSLETIETVEINANNKEYAVSQEQNNQQSNNLITSSANSKNAAEQTLLIESKPSEISQEQNGTESNENSKTDTQNFGRYYNSGHKTIENYAQQDNRLETAALYERGSRILNIQTNNEDQYSTNKFAGGYGLKLNIKATQQLPSYNTNYRRFRPSKLIESTKNLVSGQDVLNINEAIGQTSTASSVSVENNSIDISKSSEENQEESVTVQTSTDRTYNVEIQSSQEIYSSENKDENSSENRQQIFVSQNQEDNISTKQTSEEQSNSNEEQINFSQQPIIVPDYEENSAEASVQNEATLSTQTSAEINDHTRFETTSPATVLVTPRPVSTNFLAPISAGVQLQNSEQHSNHEELKRQNVLVEIQQSVPYYLGKYEYPTAISAEIDGKRGDDYTLESAVQNIELGKTLINFPVTGFQKETQEDVNQNQLESVINVQRLPEPTKSAQFKNEDQLQEQGEHIQVSHESSVVQQQAQALPLIQTQIVEKPVEVTKYVNTPYPVPIKVPYPVDRPVAVPVAVEKIVEKPVTHIVEKQVPVPHPYPVEKVVEKQVPVTVTKYIDRPYPVKVAEPYPVETIVEKVVKQPYPVHIPVEVPVEKIVEKKVPVPHYIEKPVPVEKIVEKPVPHYIEKPYPVEVKVPIAVPHAYYVPVEVPRPYPVEVTKYITKQVPVPQPYPVKVTETVGVPVAQPVPVEVRVPHPVPVEVPKYIEKIIDRPYPVYIKTKSNYYAPSYLPPKNCDQHKSGSNHYIGLVPPRLPSLQYHPRQIRKYRNPRSNIAQTYRIEYGFMPPLIPSLEIDEHGNPIDKEGQK